ncbi:MAG: DUF6265 family protein [Thermoanaerobaculia bacterium]
MAGSWGGIRDGVTSEEHWTGAAGGMLVGMHKDIARGVANEFEFLRIAADDQGRVCYFGSPNGAPATPFCAIELSSRRVVFENRLHDFPQRILYWLDAGGDLHARIEGPMNGQQISDEWSWKRLAP